jgi:hypothetical protein
MMSPRRAAQLGVIAASIVFLSSMSVVVYSAARASDDTPPQPSVVANPGHASASNAIVAKNS